VSRKVAPVSRRPSVSRPSASHAELLLELGCEEIPAWMIERACSELKASLQKHLGEAALLEDSAIECFGGPRRLTVIIPSLRLKQADVTR
jgi:glycyl-tRNA synthetase beta chain